MAQTISGSITEGTLRTHNCGALRSADVGQQVALCGWVNKYRNLGGLHFLDLRDKYGITQLSFSQYAGDIEILKKCSLESAIRVSGVVICRPPKDRNAKMDTGEIEVQVKELELLGASDGDSLPFLPCGKNPPTKELGLTHRYLHLRSQIGRA